MVKVSVIIPTYNRFKYLLNAIESVVNQTHKDIEVIVVNDCSTEEEYYSFDFNSKFGEKLRIIHLDKNTLDNLLVSANRFKDFAILGPAKQDEYSNIVEEYESHRENYMEKIRMNKYFENENLNIEEINKLIKKKEEESKIMEHLKMKEDMVLKTLKNTMEKKRKISEIMIEKEKELDKSISKVYKIYNQL